MSGLIECVPNVSEGRNRTHIAACGRAISSVPGVHVLDIHADADHHRSVFTFVGPPNGVANAVVRLAALATTLIDLRRHRGEHPRMGALDVVPFIPLAGATMETCTEIARRVAQDLAGEHDLPVYLYGHAAQRADRHSLPDIRGRGFESLCERGLADPMQRPDYGPHVLHPSAGATAVGARDFLAAFNVLLQTPDVEIARRIARIIRTSSGGLPGVRALGFRVQGRAQVSMNLVDLRTTTPRLAFDAVQESAHHLGVEVMSSEIVGLLPSFAAAPDDAAHMRLDGSIESRTLEHRMAEAGWRWAPVASGDVRPPSAPERW
jgi:glutamate formiminotransferase